MRHGMTATRSLEHARGDRDHRRAAPFALWLAPCAAGLVAACGGGGSGTTVDAADGEDAPSTIDAAPPTPVTRLIVTEQATNRLMAFDRDADWSDDNQIAWSWSPATAPELSSTQRAWFGLLSEAKPSGGDVLVSDSRGGIAVVDAVTGAVKRVALAGGNPHSLERLPDGNLVSASSNGYLRIFVFAPTAPPNSAPTKTVDVALEFAHGVVWDAARQRLWAIGGHEVVGYRYTPGAAPALTRDVGWPLPSPWGHDLRPEADGRTLLLTTNAGAYELDREHGSFRAPTVFTNGPAIKAADRNPVSGEAAFLVATESWWTDTVRLGNAAGVRTRPGAHFYKVRWLPSPDAHAP